MYKSQVSNLKSQVLNLKSQFHDKKNISIFLPAFHIF